MFSSSLFFLSFLFLYLSFRDFVIFPVVWCDFLAPSRLSCNRTHEHDNITIIIVGSRFYSNFEPKSSIWLTWLPNERTKCPRAHKGVLLCPQTLSQSRRTRLRRAFTEATNETVNYARTVFESSLILLLLYLSATKTSLLYIYNI